MSAATCEAHRDAANPKTGCKGCALAGAKIDLAYARTQLGLAAEDLVGVAAYLPSNHPAKGRAFIRADELRDIARGKKAA